MKNKNKKNKPTKCGRWLFLHSRFSKIFRGTPLIKGILQLNPQNLSSITKTARGKKKNIEPESPPSLKETTRNLSLRYTEVEKKEEGAGARSFLCDLLLGCLKR